MTGSRPRAGAPPDASGSLADLAPETDLRRGQDRAQDADPAGSQNTAPSLGAARDPVPWLIAAAVFAAFTTISVYRYLRLSPASWDLGIFTEYVKRYAHLQAPVTDARSPGLNLLGDHFHPIVALIAPFFRLVPSPATLLIAQALLAALSVIPVSRAAAALIGTGASRAIAAAYGLSWGLQQLIDYDFHEIAFAVPLLACSLSALARGRVRAAAAWALPLVFVKEDQGFTVAAIGLIIAFGYRHRLVGAALAAWGLAWSVLAIEVIIPHFNPSHLYPYWSKGGELSPGDSIISPGGLVHQLLAAPSAKLPTLALILLPTAFLALRSPLVLAAVPSLALRFVSTNTTFWGTSWHYNATVMPIVFIAAIDAMARIRAARTRRPSPPGGTGELAGLLDRHGAAMMLAISAALAFQFPLSGLWQPQTYQLGAHVQAARAAMALVPDGTTVQTDIDLLAPLGARADAYWIGNSPLWQGSAGNPVTQYVVLDQSAGDLPPHSGSAIGYVESLNRGARYRMIYRHGGVYVFVRSAG